MEVSHGPEADRGPPKADRVRCPDLATRSTCSRASPRKRFRSLPRRRSAICCKSTHGRRFEVGAAGEHEGCGFREAASQGGAIDEEDAAVRGQRAEDFRGAEAAGHAVERDRGAARLIELHALFDADIERIPVDDGAVARLIDQHGAARTAGGTSGQ
jgi:hypothetical protein